MSHEVSSMNQDLPSMSHKGENMFFEIEHMSHEVEKILKYLQNNVTLNLVFNINYTK